MKVIVKTGYLAAAACLCLLVSTSSAENPPRVRRHRTSPQGDSSAAPEGVPFAPGGPVFRGPGNSQGPSQFQRNPVMRGRQYQPARSSAATPAPGRVTRGRREESDAKASGSARHVSRKPQTPAKRERESDNGRGHSEGSRGSQGRQENQEAPSERHGHTQPEQSKPTQTPDNAEPAGVAPSRTLPPQIAIPQQPAEPASPVSPPGPPGPAAPVQMPPQVTSTARPSAIETRRRAQPALSDLSEDERTKLHSAHEAALNDPNLAASRDQYLRARREFREKLRSALLKADPSVQPILEKIGREKREDQ